MGKEYSMSGRKLLDKPDTKVTTVELPIILSSTIEKHLLTSDDNLKTFFIKAVVNQLEREGDFHIREMLEEEMNK